MAASDVGTALAWLVKLELQLLSRQPRMLMMDNYYRGNHPLPFLTKAHDMKMRNEFRKLLEESRSNFMRLVVDATEERLAVEGFRLSADQDSVADRPSWDLWQANQMDSQIQTAFLESLVKGVSYLSVWDDVDNDGYADIAVEDPLQTIVAYEPGSNYRRRAAAVKIWLDDVNGVRRANVYLPDLIWKFVAKNQDVPPGVPTVEQQTRIVWDLIPDGQDGPNPIPNPVGVVPIVPLRNRPRLLIEGESEIEDIYHIQNQINATLFLKQLALYFGAHKQRWVVGLTLMEDKNGKPVEPFNTAVDKLFQAEDPNVKFGEFQQTDPKGYIDSIEQDVLHIAVTSRTPRHYLIQQGQSPSGDAIKSAEAGLVKKVTRKQRTFGEGIEEAFRLARLLQGADDAPPDSEVVWADAQQHSEGVITDAIVKQYLVGLVPHATALERLGYTQVQIAQILASPDDQFAPPLADSSVVQMEDKSAILSKIAREPK